MRMDHHLSHGFKVRPFAKGMRACYFRPLHLLGLSSQYSAWNKEILLFTTCSQLCT